MRLIPEIFRRHHAAPDSPPLTGQQLPWLLALAALVSLPHLQQLPLWLVGGALAILGWRYWLWQRQAPLPPRYLQRLLTAAATIGVLFELPHYSLRDSGVTLLLLLLGLKSLESQHRRDAQALILLSLFLLLTHFFYSQSIPTALWLLGTLIVLLGALFRLYGPARPDSRQVLRHSLLLLLQAIPFMLVLYLLVPRIDGPLWGRPAPTAGRTGLSDHMAPGSVSQLIPSTAIAFRVEFATPPPPPSELYWRGPVFDRFSAGQWTMVQYLLTPPLHIEPTAPLSRYTLTLEANDQPWLLPLGMPSTILPGTTLSGNGVWQRRQPVRERLRLTLTTASAYRFNAQGEDPEILRQALQLPPQGNPRSRQLIAAWQASAHQPLNPARLAERILDHFRQQPFHYTLNPPLLEGDSIDAFLFDSQRGFCEHYAGAFVFLLRAGGVPARVVTGYQGGEWNPYDQTLIVRQSDAHAWAEVWLAEQGWVRYDPTAAVAPERVEHGLAAALPENETLPFSLRGNQPGWQELRQLRQQWEALNHRWNRWVLGYNAERQREFLSTLGLTPDWRQLLAWLTGLCGGLLLLLFGWLLRQQRPRPDPDLRLWQAYGRQLQRLGYAPAAWEGPQALARRLGQHPQLSPLHDNLRTATDCWIALRYGPPLSPEQQGQQRRRLRRCLWQLRSTSRRALSRRAAIAHR